MDLRLFRHGPPGFGLLVLLGYELRVVPGLPGEMGAGWSMAKTGQESMAECSSRGGTERRFNAGSPTPSEAQLERGDTEPYAPHLPNLYSLVSMLQYWFGGISI